MSRFSSELVVLVSAMVVALFARCAPAPTPAPARASAFDARASALDTSSELLVSLDLDADECEEYARRWGRRSPGCPKPTAGDRWSADHELGSAPLTAAFRDVQLQNAGDAVLWVDAQGNVGLRVPVERIVYYDAGGQPIGGAFVTERCRRSLETQPVKPTAVVCLEDDTLIRVLEGTPP